MKPENQDFFNSVEQEFQRRMRYHAAWEGLKRDGAKALRSAGYSAPNTGERIRVPSSILTQNTDEVESSLSYSDWVQVTEDDPGFSVSDALRAEPVQANPDQLADTTNPYGTAPASFDLEQLETAGWLLKSLDKLLTENENVIFRARFQDKKTFAEIAVQTRTSIPYCHKAFSNAVRKIKVQYIRLARGGR